MSAARTDLAARVGEPKFVRSDFLMIKDSSFIHVVLETDSLGLPRPWNAKKENEEPEQFFRFRETYPYLLLKRLREVTPQHEVIVTNLGQRASTMSATALKRADLLSYMEPSAAIVHHGIVDCWVRANEARRFRVSKDEFRAFVEQVLETKAKLAPDLPLIFIGIMPTTAAMLARVPEQNEIISDYNQILRETIADRAIFLDVERMFGHLIEQVVHLDGHHLSRTGHRLYADELFRLLLIHGLTE